MNKRQYLLFLYIMNKRRCKNNKYKVNASNKRLKTKNFERKPIPKKVLTKYQEEKRKASIIMLKIIAIYYGCTFVIAFIFPPIILTIPFFLVYIIIKAVILTKKINKYK